MGQEYKIDRIKKITYRGQRKKSIPSLKCRFLAKSHLVRVNANGIELRYVNFKGSIFTDVNFQGSKIIGCDFWGATFNRCDFQNAIISDSIFMASRFKECNFGGSEIRYCYFVNTGINDCSDSAYEDNCVILNKYPSWDISSELMKAFEDIKYDENLRKTGVLWTSDKKINQITISLMQKKYSDEEIIHFIEYLRDQPTEKITTSKKFVSELYKARKAGNI